MASSYKSLKRQVVTIDDSLKQKNCCIDREVRVDLTGKRWYSIRNNDRDAQVSGGSYNDLFNYV
jgi:hypothetical protein